MVTDIARPSTRISNGSSTARVSGRSTMWPPSTRVTRRRSVTRPTSSTFPRQDGRMRAVQIVDLTGPATALQSVDLPDPQPTSGQVLIDVRAAGVAFPEVLQTRGMYQLKPPVPFVPGSEIAGVVS